MKRVVRHLGGVVSMALGSTVVFGLVYAMNELGRAPEKEPPRQAADFTVDKPPEKQPPQRPAAPPRPQRNPAPVRHAPPPSLTTALSGMSFGLPQFQSDALVGTDELLAGAAAGAKMIMTADSVDTPPRRRSCAAPAYPDRARQRGIQGHVTLKLRLSERGEVEDVRVVEAEPSGVFEDAALQALRSCSFEPATYKGQAVAMVERAFAESTIGELVAEAARQDVLCAPSHISETTAARRDGRRPKRGRWARKTQHHTSANRSLSEAKDGQ